MNVVASTAPIFAFKKQTNIDKLVARLEKHTSEWEVRDPIDKQDLQSGKLAF
jgi:hypothetical protein